MLNPIKTLYHSLADPKVYSNLSRESTLHLFLYALICYFFYSVILSTFLTVRWLPQAKIAVNHAVSDISQQYPPNLTLTFNEQGLQTSGVAEPIIIKTGPLDITLTSQNLTLAHPNLPDPLIIPFADLALSGSFDSANIKAKLQAFSTNFNQVAYLPVILGLTLGFMIVYFPIRLIYCLLTAGLFYLLGKLTPNPIKLTVYFKLCLTALVAAESINLLTTIIYSQPTPLVFTLAFIGYTFTAVYTTTRNQK